MRVWAVIAVVGCSAPPSPVAPAPPARDLAIAEPAPPPSRAVGEPDEPLLQRRRSASDRLPEPERDGRELWAPCVRAFVDRHPADARRALAAAFARHDVVCVRDGSVTIAPPRDYRGSSYIAYVGTLGPVRNDLEVVIVACAVPAFEHVTLAYDGKRWTSPRALSQHVDGCAVLRIPDVRALRRVVRELLDAREAVMRIDGTDEIAITEAMRQDVRLLLDAADAISAR